MNYFNSYFSRVLDSDELDDKQIDSVIKELKERIEKAKGHEKYYIDQIIACSEGVKDVKEKQEQANKLIKLLEKQKSKKEDTKDDDE